MKQHTLFMFLIIICSYQYCYLSVTSSSKMYNNWQRITHCRYLTCVTEMSMSSTFFIQNTSANLGTGYLCCPRSFQGIVRRRFISERKGYSKNADVIFDNLFSNKEKMGIFKTSVSPQHKFTDI